MSNINQISGLLQNITNQSGSKQIKGDGQKPGEGVSFSETIKDFLTAVNQSQKTAGKKVADVVEGKSENLAEAMTRLEESKLNFQLLLEIRSRLLDSYKEIQRMQV
ncbi:MAG: flagellar hook-basal body complex protein FliE [FCB group bacterium]|nr:flagellar hook-basal body complex protein FliE [FCB group bacterium]